MRIRLSLSALALGLLVSAARSIEPPTTRVSDLELTRRVQTVLTTDSVLKSRSLIVSVVDGVAVVGGPVASDDESARIVQVLKVVPDLVDVKVSAWVPAIDDPLKRKIADRLNGIESPPPTRRLTSIEPRPAARVTVQRHEPPLPGVAFLGDPFPKATAPRTKLDAAYSPLPAPVPAAPDGPPQYPTIPPPAVPVKPSQDVASAIEAVRTSEARYAGLTVDVTAGAVTVAGAVTHADIAWEFVAAVRKVPGVDRVVMGRLNLP